MEYNSIDPSLFTEEIFGDILRVYFNKLSVKDNIRDVKTRLLENDRVEVSGTGIYMTIPKEEWTAAIIKSANQKNETTNTRD